ncbi:MAG: neutral/alkaline non-lysosomal ceramidase N-terminal domain-containing protein, partial [Gammaproteobacteria bacterium]
FDVQRLQKNRNRGNPRDYVIKTANLLLAKDAGTGGWLGGLVNFAVHGVAVRRRDTGFSADIPGSIERNLERMLMQENKGQEERPTMLFINGAVGDVTTRTKGRKELEKIGGSFADQTRSHLKSLRPVSPNWKTKSATFDIGEAGLHLKTCAESPFLKKLMPESATLPLSPWFPKRTKVWMIELGDIAMMTWPGEPTTSLGRKDVEITRPLAFRQTWILGLTNDYLAYFTTPEEFKTGSYEACFSLYGPGLGNSIVERHKSLSLTP